MVVSAPKTPQRVQGNRTNEVNNPTDLVELTANEWRDGAGHIVSSAKLELLDGLGELSSVEEGRNEAIEVASPS